MKDYYENNVEKIDGDDYTKMVMTTWIWWWPPEYGDNHLNMVMEHMTKMRSLAARANISPWKVLPPENQKENDWHNKMEWPYHHHHHHEQQKHHHGFHLIITCVSCRKRRWPKRCLKLPNCQPADRDYYYYYYYWGSCNVLQGNIISSVRSSNSHPDLLLIHPTLSDLACLPLYNNIGLSLSEPKQLYKKQSLESSAGYMYTIFAR